MAPAIQNLTLTGVNETSARLPHASHLICVNQMPRLHNFDIFGAVTIGPVELQAVGFPP